MKRLLTRLMGLLLCVSILLSLAISSVSVAAAPTSAEVAANNLATQITGGKEFIVERPVANGNTVDATAFGLSETNAPAANQAALKAALAYIKESGAWKLNIPNGKYYIGGGDKYAIHLNGIENLQIEGNGSTLLFSEHGDGGGNAAYFGIYNTEKIEILNLKLDWDWSVYPLFGLGTVTAIDTANYTLTYKIDDEYPLSENLLLGGVRSWDDAIMNRSETVGFAPPSVAANGFVSMTSSGQNVTLKFDKASRLNGAEIGDRSQFWFKTSQLINGFRMQDNKHLTFNNVHVYSAPYQTIFSNATEYFQIVNCSVEPTPGSGRVISSYGGLEVHSVDGYFKMEGTTLDGICDDNLHLSNHYIGAEESYANTSNKSANADTYTAVSSAGTDGANAMLDEYTIRATHLHQWMVETEIYVGATMTLYDKELIPTGWTSTVESFQWRTNQWKSGGLHDCIIKFKDKLPTGYKSTHMLYNSDKFVGNYIVKNNTFKNGLCHAMYMGLPNGTIENNYIENFAYPGLVLHSTVRWKYWTIGTPIDNVIIRGNTLINTNTADRDPAALFVGGGRDYQPTNYNPVAGRITTNVLVENNTVDGTRGAAFGTMSSKNIVVRNNKFINSDTAKGHAANTYSGGIKSNAYITYADNVYFIGNVLNNTDAAKNLYIDTAKTTGIVSEGNYIQKYDSAGAAIVNVDDFGYSETGGTWHQSGGYAGHDGVYSRYSTEIGATARWTPVIADGAYEIYIYKITPASVSDNANSDEAAQVTVKWATGSRSFSVNFKEGSSGFVKITDTGYNTFNFSSKVPCYVEITNAHGKTTRTSAVKFVRSGNA